MQANSVYAHISKIVTYIEPIKYVSECLYFVSCVFRKLGNNWKLDDDVVSDIEAFTCTMYGYPREREINLVRSKMLKKMVGEDEPLNMKSKIDLARLPPCRDSLIPHCQRVNYRLATYKKAHIPIFEKPKPYEDNQGWTRGESKTI